MEEVPPEVISVRDNSRIIRQQVRQDLSWFDAILQNHRLEIDAIRRQSDHQSQAVADVQKHLGDVIRTVQGYKCSENGARWEAIGNEMA